jgi:hypothetical protein
MVARKKTSTAVAKAKANEVAQLPAGIDFSDDLGGGMEGADRDSFAIPFLRVLHKQSPQCDEADPNYIEGAKQGKLFNSVTLQLFDGEEGVLFVPCAFQRRFLRWGPRSGDGAGYKGEYLPEDVARMRDEGEVKELDGRLFFPLDNGEVSEKKCDRLADTRSHFGLILDGDEVHQVVLALSSTQIKKSKQLMSMLSAVRVQGPNGLVSPPTWANKVRITTVPESNDQGSWHGVKFAPEGFVDSADLYNAGKAFHDAISKGEAKANFAETEEASAEKF